MKLWKRTILAGAALLFAAGAAYAEDVKIGFVVKQPEEPWFQDEWSSLKRRRRRRASPSSRSAPRTARR